jgi:hypothetical protein
LTGMNNREEQYRLLRSVFDVSNTLLKSAESANLDRTDELLHEQQRLLEMAIERKKSLDAEVRSVEGGNRFHRQISLLTAGIEENMKRLINVLQKRKNDRYTHIKEARKHKSLTTYIR